MCSLIRNCWFKFLKYVIEVVFTIILVFYFFYCHIYQFENPAFKIAGLLPIVFILVYFVGYRFLLKIENKSVKLYKISIFGISVLIYLAWGLFAKTQAVSDYEVLINGANEMCKGNFASLSFDKSNYFYFYNFQTGFVCFLALIIKMFGTRLVVLKIIEILIMSLANVFVYDIASKAYSRKAGVIASLLYMLLSFNIVGSSVINNQHISTFIICIAILLFMKNKWQFNIISGILLGIALILRPSAVVFVVAFVAFLVWKGFTDSFKDWKKILLSIVLIFIVAFGVGKIFDIFMVNNKIVPISAIDGNAKYFKFLLGLQGNGLYGFATESAGKTQVYFDLQRLDFDYDKYNEECKKKVVDICINDTQKLLEFLGKKLVVFCGAADNQIDFASDNIKNKEVCSLMSYYGYVQYVLLLALSLITSIVFIFKEDMILYEKEKNYDKLFKIVFVLFFFAHLLIEVQPRYRYDQYLMMCLISAPCVMLLFNKVEEKLKI